MAMELWTPQHTRTLLPALAVMLLIGIVLRLTMGGKSFKIRMIPIQVIAVILVLLEIGKQAVSFSRGYDLYHIPLHFCSLFIFAMPAMAFYRGKHQKQVFGVTSALCGSVFLLMLIYPNLIYGPWNVEGFFKDYLDFLSGGCSKSPIDLLKGAGVDMTDPAPVEAALALFGELLDEMESLIDE